MLFLFTGAFLFVLFGYKGSVGYHSKEHFSNGSLRALECPK